MKRFNEISLYEAEGAKCFDRDTLAVKMTLVIGRPPVQMLTSEEDANICDTKWKSLSPVHAAANPRGKHYFASHVYIGYSEARRPLLSFMTRKALLFNVIAQVLSVACPYTTSYTG